MNLNYDISKITHALRDFYNATGINTRLTNANFEEISSMQDPENSYCRYLKQLPSAQKQCRLSDLMLIEKCKSSKKMEMHICHAGLVDIVLPITYNDEILAFLIFGQIKQDTDFSALRGRIAELGLNTETMEGLYNNLTTFDRDRIESIANIAVMLTKHLLLENFLKPYFNENIDKVLNYIQKNYERDLSIQIISQSTNLSKSTLYKLFHSHLGCTVNEYLNRLRVEKSVDMLSKTDLSIEEISRRVGFASSSYYTRTFKKVMGCAPLKYRKASK